MREATAQWLRAAERDLESSRALMDKAIFEHAAFHCQQACEKALKALFAERGEHPRTHSGTELLVELKRTGLSISEQLFSTVRRLDRSFIDTRYPNGVGTGPDQLYDQTLAKELLECSQFVMDFVKSNLS